MFWCPRAGTNHVVMWHVRCAGCWARRLKCTWAAQIVQTIWRASDGRVTTVAKSAYARFLYHSWTSRSQCSWSEYETVITPLSEMRRMGTAVSQIMLNGHPLINDEMISADVTNRVTRVRCTFSPSIRPPRVSRKQRAVKHSRSQGSNHSQHPLYTRMSIRGATVCHQSFLSV